MIIPAILIFMISGALTLARTCYFAILERPWGKGRSRMPPLICPLTTIEIRGKDEQKVWEVLNPTIPDLTTLIIS